MVKRQGGEAPFSSSISRDLDATTAGLVERRRGPDTCKPRGMLGSSTRQVHVYGRKGRTRVVQDAPSVLEEQAPPSTPPRKTTLPPTRGLFTGVDFRSTWDAWVHSPRETFASKVSTPWKQWAKGSSHARTPLRPKSANAQALCDTLEDLSLEDRGVASLLRRVQQSHPLDFEQLLTDLAPTYEKVGEASYSEVYRCTSSGAILKVIPLDMGTEHAGIALSSPDSVDREVAMIYALSHASHPCAHHFVQLQRAHVVRGAYPSALLRAWDTFKAEQASRSENARPSVLPSTQLYGVIVMNDAGQELEGLSLRGWVERAAVFWQVACAVAFAEHTCSFEHRDLHMGNILVRRDASQPASDVGALSALWRTYAPDRTGVHATIIDYSLSRMELDGQTVAYDFSDASLFAGRGDAQYDVYRHMRRLVSEDWQGHAPMTNVLWLQFVLQRMLAMHAPPDDEPGTAAAHAYDLLVQAEQLAHEAIEHAQRHVPQRRVSTRSKRRSIQRSHDAWKVLPDAHRPRITSTWTWLQALLPYVEVSEACADAGWLAERGGAAGS